MNDYRADSSFETMKRNNTATLPSRAIAGVALGALTGALAMMTAIRLPGFLISAFFGTFGRTGSPDNWREALVGTVVSIVAGVIVSPWGWIGALAGSAIAWRKLNAISRASASASSKSPLSPPSTRKAVPGGILFGAGMVLLLFSVAIFPSVMVWMLAFFTLPPAVVLLFSGLMGIRKSGLGGLATATGLVQFTVAFVAILIAAVGATSASCRILLPPTLNPGPSGLWWLVAGISWMVAMPLIRRGFSQWADIPDRRKPLWCAAITCFPIAAFLLHFTLASIGLLPLNA